MSSLSSSPLNASALPYPPVPQNTNKSGSADDHHHSYPFHPSIWGDFFLSYEKDGKKIDAWTRKVEELKCEVKRMLRTVLKGSVEEIIMIDEIQRLGVSYHFEKEINDALEQIYDANADYDHDDLKTTALRFRLLRHEGYNVSSGPVILNHINAPF